MTDTLQPIVESEYYKRIAESLKDTCFEVFCHYSPGKIFDPRTVIFGEMHPRGDEFSLDIVTEDSSYRVVKRNIKIPKNHFDIRKIILELMDSDKISILLEGPYIGEVNRDTAPRYLRTFLDKAMIKYDDCLESRKILDELEKKYIAELSVSRPRPKNISELNEFHTRREYYFANTIKSEVDKGRRTFQVVGLDHLTDLSKILASLNVPHICLKQDESPGSAGRKLIDFENNITISSTDRSRL